MNKDQFCQVVLLPQGEFQTFLSAGREGAPRRPGVACSARTGSRRSSAGWSTTGADSTRSVGSPRPASTGCWPAPTRSSPGPGSLRSCPHAPGIDEGRDADGRDPASTAVLGTADGARTDYLHAVAAVQERLAALTTAASDAAEVELAAKEEAKAASTRSTRLGPWSISSAGIEKHRTGSPSSCRRPVRFVDVSVRSCSPGAPRPSSPSWRSSPRRRQASAQPLRRSRLRATTTCRVRSDGPRRAADLIPRRHRTVHRRPAARARRSRRLGRGADRARPDDCDVADRRRGDRSRARPRRPRWSRGSRRFPPSRPSARAPLQHATPSRVAAGFAGAVAVARHTRDAARASAALAAEAESLDEALVSRPRGSSRCTRRAPSRARPPDRRHGGHPRDRHSSRQPCQVCGSADHPSPARPRPTRSHRTTKPRPRTSYAGPRTRWASCSCAVSASGPARRPPTMRPTGTPPRPRRSLDSPSRAKPERLHHGGRAAGRAAATRRSLEVELTQAQQELTEASAALHALEARRPERRPDGRAAEAPDRGGRWVTPAPSRTRRRRARQTERARRTHGGAARAQRRDGGRAAAVERLDHLVAGSVFATVRQVRDAVRSDADIASAEALNRAHATDKSATSRSWPTRPADRGGSRPDP